MTLPQVTKKLLFAHFRTKLGHGADGILQNVHLKMGVMGRIVWRKINDQSGDKLYNVVKSFEGA
jgi:hypothetical protein